jgi:two-component system chemotaxis response regulator CheY
VARIFTIDDSVSIRELLRFVLERAGHEVFQAADGDDALVQAASRSSDLVVTDIHMPHMNGIELIRNLRQMPSYRYVPILVLTTESGTDWKQEGKAAGATGWLVKPFDPPTLLSTIARVLP